LGFTGLVVGAAPPLAEVAIDPATAPPATAAKLVVVLARAAGALAQSAIDKLRPSATPRVRNRTS
jgi:hypothetical protein